jgi:BirA family transcriptional regulator, biotin operon repressor / biotin---[acetyl-CoA-carboxylase] ligase
MSGRLPDLERVWSAGFTGRFGHPLEIHHELSSTMDNMAALAEAGGPEGALVLAESQSRGRGRKGRSWVSPPGSSLLIALLLRPRWNPEMGGVFSLAAALATVRAVAGFGLELQVKWPNDLLWRGRKVAGLISEARLCSQGYRHLILGIGINVHQGVDDFPPELRELSSSLDQAAGRRLKRGEVLARWLLEMEQICDDLGRGRDLHLLAEWRRYWPHQGALSVDESGRELWLEDIDHRGAMVARGEAGPITINAGDLGIDLHGR